MNFAVILSGGIGSRMQTGGIPKQYMVIKGRPVIMYTLDVFEQVDEIEGYIIVADPSYYDTIRGWLQEEGKKKFLGFALPGECRQESILRGMEACMPLSKSKDDLVLIHDAVRPCVTPEQIYRNIATLEKYDASLPVVPIADTIVFSEMGERVEALVDRSKLRAGQTPEGFHLHQFLKVNQAATKEELAACTGSSFMAFNNQLTVGLYEGDHTNFKLTVPADVERFIQQLEKKEQ